MSGRGDDPGGGVPAAPVEEEATFEATLRPERLVDYVGQEPVRESLAIAIEEAPSQQKLVSRELDLAGQLIGGMADRWEPERYTDDYAAALIKVIEAKAEGESVRAPKVRPAQSTKVVDLVARLRESLAAAKTGTASKKARGSAGKARSRRAPSTRRTAKSGRAKRSSARVA